MICSGLWNGNVNVGVAVKRGSVTSTLVLGKSGVMCLLEWELESDRLGVGDVFVVVVQRKEGSVDRVVNIWPHCFDFPV
jgi:hypothetical protein